MFPTVHADDITRIPTDDGSEKVIDPSQQLVDQFSAFLYDGLITDDGHVLNAIDRGTLINGRARDASPEYWKFLDNINEYATAYPTADPRVWVPLAKKDIRHDDPVAQAALTADAERLASLNGFDKPRGGTVSAGAPPASDEDDDSGGMWGAVTSFVGGLFGGTSTAETAAIGMEGDAVSVSDPESDGTPFKSRVMGQSIADKPIDAFNEVADVTGFKTAARNLINIGMAPYQSVVQGEFRSITDDLKDGDYKSAYMHGFAANPIIEAAFIAAENLTGTQFYREGGEEQTIWSQSNAGQQLLDLFGQGGPEQFPGGINDEPGIQYTHNGDGYLPDMAGADLTPSDEPNSGTTAAQWQRQAALNANTLVPEQRIENSAAELAKLQKIARIESPEKAIEWAAEQGYVYDPVQKALLRPAQGSTIGRWTAIQIGADPYTTRYNTISGSIDLATNVLDPTLWLPAGGFRAGLGILRGGKTIAGGGQRIVRTTEEVVRGMDDVTDDLAKGVAQADIERKYGGKLVFSKPEPTGGRITVRGEDLEPEIQELIDAGHAGSRESALLGLEADGWQWDIRRGTFGDALTPEDLNVITAAAARNPNEVNPNLVDHVADGAGGATVKNGSTVGFVRTTLLPRADYEHLDQISDLADDVAENGVREPIVVRFDPSNGRAVLDDGNKRLAAIRANGDYWAPVRVVAGKVGKDEGEKMVNARSRWVDEDGDRIWPATMHPRHIYGDADVWREGRSELPNIAKDYDGIAATDHIVEFFQTRAGYETARAISEMDNAGDIWLMSSRKFTPELANRLAKATTPEEVMEVLAPKLGMRVQRVNDLLRFVGSDALPTYTTRQRLWKMTDVERLKESVPGKVNGMSLLPDRSVHVDDMEAYIDQVIRFARVFDPKVLEDPDFIAALNRAFETAELKGYTRRAGRYEAYYGRGDQQVIADEAGNIVHDHKEVAQALREGHTVEELLSEAPPGSTLVQGKDGVFTVMERWAHEQRGIPKSLARRVFEAYDQVDVENRLYDKTADGENWKQIWSHAARSEPGSEADALGQMLALPNIAMVRKADSEWRKKYSKYTGTPEEKLVDSMLNAIAESGMRAWKDAMLTGLGLRILPYAVRNTADTHITVALNGGSSIIRRPDRLLHWILTSAVRQAQKGDSRARKAIDRYAQAIHDNPAVKWLWPDKLAHDIENNPFVDSLDELARGTINDEGLYHFSEALNMGTSGRGSQGRDVGYYVGKGTAPRRVSITDEAERDNYVEGLANAMWRSVNSPTMVRLARGDDHEEVLQWFMHSAEGGREVMSRFGPEARAKLATPEGAREYIADRWDYLMQQTGGDPELLDMIGRRGKFDYDEVVDGKTVRKTSNFFDKNHATGDLSPNKQFLKLLRDKADSGVSLPRDTWYEPKVKTVKQGWNTFMDTMYHWAGKMEDVYAREPYFKERFFAHGKEFARLLDPAERAAWVRDLRANGDNHFADEIEKIHDAGVMSRKDLNEAASWLAYKDIRDVAYNAADRREWAYSLRFISPFVQAAVNGMYRWTKAAIRNPESDYRIMRGLQALTGEDSAFINDWLATSAPDGSSFIYEDPYGQRRIAIPGMGIAASLLNTPQDVASSWSFGAAGLNFAFPSLERAQLRADAGVDGQNEVLAKALFPGFGPMPNMALSMLTDGTSDWAIDYLQPYGTPGQGFWDTARQYLVPSALNRITDLAKPSVAEENRRSTRAMQLYAMITREQGGVQNMSEADRKDALQRAKQLSWSMSGMELVTNMFTPSASGADLLYKNVTDIPDHIIYASQVGQILQKYRSANNGDYAKAEAEFVNDVGLDLLALTSPSSFDTDAAPPTRGALAVKQDYEEGYEKYAPVLSTLLGEQDGVAEFDPNLFAYQLGYGERISLPLDERVKAANERIFDYIYAHNSRKIANSTLDDMDKNFADNELRSNLQQMGWAGVSKGRTMEERQTQFDLMEEAARDPQMRPFIGETTSDYLLGYFEMRRQMIQSLQEKGLQGDLSTVTTSGIEEKTALLALGETMASRDERFRYIWRFGLRSEVVMDEEEG